MSDTKTPTQEEYSRFLHSLELVRVRLISCDVKANIDQPDQPKSVVTLNSEANYEIEDWGFEAFQRYEVIISEETTEREFGSIRGVFGLAFQTKLLGSIENFADYFGIFQGSNLPLNSYPFFREFVQSMTLRMNWPALTLPLLQISQASPEDDETELNTENRSE